MSSRRSVRQLIVAVLLGVLVGGGLFAITPAGAEVSQSLATSWKKIWKKELKPLADRRYYKKSQSDAKYASKAEAAAAAAAAQSAATSAANSATDGKLGGYYKKTESDARYAPFPTTIRGTFSVEFQAAAAGANGSDGISFGSNLSAAPTAHLIPDGGPVPADCSGTPAAPGAAPGHLCVFIALQSANAGNARLFNAVGSSGASSFGTNTAVTSTAAGAVFYYGSWAVTPAGLAAAPRSTPSQGGAREGQ